MGSPHHYLTDDQCDKFHLGPLLYPELQQKTLSIFLHNQELSFQRSLESGEEMLLLSQHHCWIDRTGDICLSTIAGVIELGTSSSSHSFLTLQPNLLPNPTESAQV